VVLKQNDRLGENFENLDRILDQLLATLRQGNWDALPEMESSLLPALHAIERSGPATGFKKEASKIAAVQEKLGLAIRECQERKSQIAPLLDSLDRIREKSPDL